MWKITSRRRGDWGRSSDDLLAFHQCVVTRFAQNVLCLCAANKLYGRQNQTPHRKVAPITATNALAAVWFVTVPVDVNVDRHVFRRHNFHLSRFLFCTSFHAAIAACFVW
jgi:hypothetical protein